MYNARFVSDAGKEMRFGYEHGSVFDISPIDSLEVEISTSQGFQQIGETVEGQTVRGITRTITGNIIDNSNWEMAKSMMIAVFAPFTSGKLYFNDDYFCNCYVKTTPLFVNYGSKGRDNKFSISLYCPDPFWYQAKQNAVEISRLWTPAFSFPTMLDNHIFGTRASEQAVNVSNDGNVETPVTFKVRFFGLVQNVEIVCKTHERQIILEGSFDDDDVVEIGWTGNRLQVLRNGVNDFSILSESSNLFMLPPGENLMDCRAVEGTGTISVFAYYYNRFSGVSDRE